MQNFLDLLGFALAILIGLGIAVLLDYPLDQLEKEIKFIYPKEPETIKVILSN